MKLLLLIMTTIVFNQNLSASTANLGKTFYRFYNSSPEDVFIEPLCPDGVNCLTDGLLVHLEYNVPCTHQLVTFNYKTIEINGVTHIFINATYGNLAPPAQAVCQAFSTEIKTVPLANFFGEIKVHNLGVSQRPDRKLIQPVSAELTVVKPARK